jgi:hypothetical protein
MRPVRVLHAALALLLLAACSRSVVSGSYGPFAIGASKEAVLLALERAGIRAVEPLPYPLVRLVNPTQGALEALAASDGIAVRVEDAPYALHIEFREGRVSSTWPNFGEYPYMPRYPYTPEALLARMQAGISPGMEHAAVFAALTSFRTEKKIVVEPFVVGYAKIPGSDSLPWEGEYRSLLLANDEWRFDGLAGEVWYPLRRSQVALFFHAGKLARIEHRYSML